MTNKNKNFLNSFKKKYQHHACCFNIFVILSIVGLILIILALVNNQKLSHLIKENWLNFGISLGLLLCLLATGFFIAFWTFGKEKDPRKVEDDVIYHFSVRTSSGSGSSSYNTDRDNKSTYSQSLDDIKYNQNSNYKNKNSNKAKTRRLKQKLLFIKNSNKNYSKHGYFSKTQISNKSNCRGVPKEIADKLEALRLKNTRKLSKKERRSLEKKTKSGLSNISGNTISISRNSVLRVPSKAKVSRKMTAYSMDTQITTLEPSDLSYLQSTRIHSFQKDADDETDSNYEIIDLPIDRERYRYSFSQNSSNNNQIRKIDRVSSNMSSQSLHNTHLQNNSNNNNYHRPISPRKSGDSLINGRASSNLRVINENNSCDVEDMVYFSNSAFV